MSPGKKIRVAVLFGGRSEEHEISIRSARSVVQALDRSRFELALIGIDKAGGFHFYDEESLASLGSEVEPEDASTLSVLSSLLGESERATVDVVFPVLHGPYGEDGTIQGLLETFNIPYVGAGVLGSAVGMDKDVQKRLLREASLPVVPFEVVTTRAWSENARALRERCFALGKPLFVKPANLGSSVGISKVSGSRDAGALDRAVGEALAYDTKVIVERGIIGREIECSVLGNDDPAASLPGEIVPGDDFYSYDDKYSAASTAKLLVPAPLSPQVVQAAQELAVRAFQVLECSGMARVDFFLEKSTERLYVNEINTIPGFTSISMYPKLWEASGIGYRDLITKLIELALERHASRLRLQRG
jgi:D-alanine-D-alanine ligase